MENEERMYACLAGIRIIIGFMMIWAFFDKLFGLGMLTTPEAAIINGGSPTEYYLTFLVSGPFEGIYHSLAGNAVLDFLLMFGLFCVGFGLLLGIASKLTTIGGVVMLLLMFTLALPPEDNPIVNFRIVYVLAIIAIYYSGAFDCYGLNGRWKELTIVKKFPLLQ